MLYSTLRNAAWYIRRFSECKLYVFPAGKGQPNDPTSPVTTLRTAWTKVRDKARPCFLSGVCVWSASAFQTPQIGAESSPSLSEARLDKTFGEAGWKRDVGCSSRRGQCAGKRRGLDRLIGTIFREDYQRNNRPDWDVAGLNGEGQLPWCVPGTAPL